MKNISLVFLLLLSSHFYSCTSMAVSLPSDAVLAAIRFYKKNFGKSVLVPDVNHFEVSLLNDSVWHVESPLVYKRLSYPTISKYGYSETGLLLISRKDAKVLYFSIHLPSTIKETHAQEVMFYTTPR